MEAQQGCLAGLMQGFERWLGRIPPITSRPWPPVGSSPEPAPGTPIHPPPPTIEVFAAPGHGRTSYIWSLMFMLRQLSRVWPGYLCWPSDDDTWRSLHRIHHDMQQGRLPGRSGRETAVAQRHALHLRNLNPWGDRHFVVWDSPETSLSPGGSSTVAAGRPLSWNMPVLWLLSLPDLDAVSGRFLDLALDDLVRARLASGDAARARQLRLVVVFTKGDAITDLPPELRTLLKADPLAKALASDTDGLFRAHDQITLAKPAGARRPEQFPVNDPLRSYFESRHQVDALIRAWMNSNSAGRALLGRAAELDVELKLSLVSATGSGFTNGKRLATAWSPRRVLDPYFWSLELGA